MESLSSISIVILTHNRPQHLLRITSEISKFSEHGAEIIIVDNASETPAEKLLDPFPFEIIRLQENQGAVARNHGLLKATGDIVVTLDDDLFGLTEASLYALERQFKGDRSLGAICFRVLSAEPPHESINWCHHYRKELFEKEHFVTDEISEGAVAFRRTALSKTDLYPSEFFISHEGAALAFQLMNAGYRILYNPDISMYHSVADEGRRSTRRYYFDTRNVIWLAARYFPFRRAPMLLLKGVGGMLIYSLRDLHFLTWCRAILDGLAGLPHQISRRNPPQPNALSVLREIDPHRPSFVYMAKKRLTKRKVEI